MPFLAQAAGDGRNDGENITIFDLRIQSLEMANIFVVQEDIDEPPQLSLVIANAGPDPAALLHYEQLGRSPRRH